MNYSLFFASINGLLFLNACIRDRLFRVHLCCADRLLSLTQTIQQCVTYSDVHVVDSMRIIMKQYSVLQLHSHEATKYNIRSSRRVQIRRPHAESRPGPQFDFRVCTAQRIEATVHSFVHLLAMLNDVPFFS